jgi:hypothetical protein
MNNNNEIYFGDKNTFAIKYIPENKLLDERGHIWYYAYLHLVINGQLIGHPDESCSVNNWTYKLERFLNNIRDNKLKNEAFLNKRDDEIFELIWKANQLPEDFNPVYSHLPQLDSSVWAYCRLSLGETIDAYSITVTEEDSSLKFIWKGWQEPCPVELIGVLFSKSVDKNFVIQTLQECIDYVSKDLENYKEIITPVNEDQQEFWKMLKATATTLTENTHRKMTCEFSELVWEQLDDLGKKALLIAKERIKENVSEQECDIYLNQLQKQLNGSSPSPYSPVMWALQKPTNSYPAWYAAGIAGSNVVDLNISTYRQLCDIIKKYTA